ncbi:Protein of unknown function [Paramicrobacterium humi]|uniref:DUF3263 domain-containing protein n=1 Tax=Paramicrobacterium humi TaxID=640635 RepID=A0A1H4NS83_9MICO|nr:DUF3263 domain-containing protein [Microbacterium humi]SEB98083.1 Protein of unknown function [Microbacterium humi]
MDQVTDHGHDDEADCDALSERDIAILDFERQWWKHAGTKEEAIRARFALSSARYYQLLAALIKRPAALKHDPMLVKRLQRVRDQRMAARVRRTSLDR